MDSESKRSYLDAAYSAEVSEYYLPQTLLSPSQRNVIVLVSALFNRPINQNMKQ